MLCQFIFVTESKKKEPIFLNSAEDNKSGRSPLDKFFTNFSSAQLRNFLISASLAYLAGIPVFVIENFGYPETPFTAGFSKIIDLLTLVEFVAI